MGTFGGLPFFKHIFMCWNFAFLHSVILLMGVRRAMKIPGMRSIIVQEQSKQPRPHEPWGGGRGNRVPGFSEKADFME